MYRFEVKNNDDFALIQLILTPTTLFFPFIKKQLAISEIIRLTSTSLTLLNHSFSFDPYYFPSLCQSLRLYKIPYFCQPSLEETNLLTKSFTLKDIVEDSFNTSQFSYAAFCTYQGIPKCIVVKVDQSFNIIKQKAVINILYSITRFSLKKEIVKIQDKFQLVFQYCADAVAFVMQLQKYQEPMDIQENFFKQNNKQQTNSMAFLCPIPEKQISQFNERKSKNQFVSSQMCFQKIPFEKKQTQQYIKQFIPTYQKNQCIDQFDKFNVNQQIREKQFFQRQYKIQNQQQFLFGSQNRQQCFDSPTSKKHYIQNITNITNKILQQPTQNIQKRLNFNICPSIPQNKQIMQVEQIVNTNNLLKQVKKKKTQLKQFFSLERQIKNKIKNQLFDGRMQTRQMTSCQKQVSFQIEKNNRDKINESKKKLLFDNKKVINYQYPISIVQLQGNRIVSLTSSSLRVDRLSSHCQVLGKVTAPIGSHTLIDNSPNLTIVAKESLLQYDIICHRNVAQFNTPQIKTGALFDTNTYALVGQKWVGLLDRRSQEITQQILSHNVCEKITVKNNCIVVGQSKGIVKIFDVRKMKQSFNNFLLETNAQFKAISITDSGNIFCDCGKGFLIDCLDQSIYNKKVFRKSTIKEYQIKGAVQYSISKCQQEVIGVKKNEIIRQRKDIQKSIHLDKVFYGQHKKNGNKYSLVLGYYHQEQYCFSIVR